MVHQRTRGDIFICIRSRDLQLTGQDGYNNAGRLNLFQFENFKVLLDYAHNPAGMKALKEFTDTIECSKKVGIIAGVGDRRVEDNNEMGSLAAEMFDEIIIRQDKHLRGKTEAELIKMLDDGIKMKDPKRKQLLFLLKKKLLLLPSIMPKKIH